MDALVIGEALVDIVRDAKGSREHPGGSPANVAFGLARLGVGTSLLTDLGDDERGGAVRRHLEGAGVRVLATRPEHRTSTAEAVLDESGSAAYTFEIGWDPGLPHELPRADVLHTGSIAAFLHPGDAVVLQKMGEWRASATVTFDPNIRPDLVGDHETALRRFEEAAALAHVVKLSDEDASWLYPQLAPRAVLDRILELGPELVALTAGGDGSLLATAEASTETEAPHVTVADTIGAGDSYMSALIARLATRRPGSLTEEELADLGRFAAAAAAITVSRAGANPPTRDEVEAALA
ncbi:carbohydrate kinase [Naasia sp. SYSU D00948]|uniref:carbohydrate kinase family protein n=1 Tax=Naasia sp. SYSU D00948 TaxID=2817379 RepID=UPI001B30FB83|nr:carbohydrate kinase [Naasia sp. SYSU D00948]